MYNPNKCINMYIRYQLRVKNSNLFIFWISKNSNIPSEKEKAFVANVGIFRREATSTDYFVRPADMSVSP